MVPIDVTPVSVFMLLTGVGYTLALAYVAFLERRRVQEEGVADDHVFSLIVPAHNEAKVIEGCLASLLQLDYPKDRFEILVVDDGSTDATGEIAARYARDHPGRVMQLRVPDDLAARGKANALNYAFRFLREESVFRDHPGWIVGVFDADGQPEPNILRKASFQFLSPRVGGVQASVRIRDKDKSWLNRMQDIEFAGFSRVTQIIRMRLTNSASLGGNGQFVRASALLAVAVNPGADMYWNPRSLTEDLDLTARMTLRNWDLRHLNTSRVWQQGVDTVRALIRQRTRWAWGSLQVFAEYVVRGKLLRTGGAALRKRLDLLVHLSLFLVSPLVFLTWVLSGIAFVGLIGVASSLPSAVMFLTSFAYLPIVGYGLLTAGGYRKRRLVLDLISFAIYTYHWVPCMYAAMWHVATGHGPVWWKTARNTESPVV